ncbi:MAG: hypothetical protein JXN61_09735 [Sedimentisphaerales bacterium]|nr:hypothetical protein [Sedimentisphaerales bacterium]
MKAKLRMFGVEGLAHLVLVCGLAIPVGAWDCYPGCSPSACEACEAGVCVYQCESADCETCFEGSCIVCFYSAQECTKCEDGECVDDDAQCTGECHDGCSGGSCVDDDSKCNSCQKCSYGNCGLKSTSDCATDSDCHETFQYCYLCKCKCQSCYAWEDVPENTLNPCPDCSNEEGGCYSSTFWITEGFAYYSGGIPPNGDIGLCGNPTKIEDVGYHIYCVDYDTDVDRIVEIVINLGLDLSTFVDCGQCVLTRVPSACYKCIIGLIIGEIVDESPCIFVDGCEHCYAFDTNCSFPIEQEVVDWGKIEEEHIGFCCPGLDWP